MPAPSNKRIHFGCFAVAMKADGDSTSNWDFLHGLQSASWNGNVGFEQIFQLGSLSIYENSELVPEIELTISRALDGYELAFTKATNTSTDPTLVAKSNIKNILGFAIYKDTDQNSTGTPDGEVQASGSFLSNATYTIPVEGIATEECTFLSQNILWNDDSNALGVDDWAGIGLTMQAPFGSLDSPIGSGGIQRGENLIFDFDGTNSDYDVNGMVAQVDTTILPPEVYGISASGTNDKSNGVDFDCHIQNITVNASLGRTPIRELGRRGAYTRNVDWPVEVTCSIETMATSGDRISLTEKGIRTPAGTDACLSAGNTQDRTIRIAMCDSTRIYLGTKNRLTSYNMNGPTTDGGDATVSYDFSTFSHFTIMHSGDSNSNYTLAADGNTYLRDV